ncbi:HlyD family type I secretion periplasmic adaptor subunit [Bradyrhizobium sp.]|jgi:HlyD family secretion protein|uniref:HlyD family type I secretion periplasmic adaptor subunit n=1 Tax=Bradyrhizobium sp. TaxID=376 RepID=UPI003C178A7A
MPYSQDHRHLDGSDRNWRSEADADRVGPQGEALILELQRLRQALHSERGDNRNQPGSSGRGETRKRQAPRKPQPARPRRKPKSTVKLAIDLWMKSFGTKAPVQAEDGSNPPVEPVVWPPHRQSPPIFPSDPIYMDLRKPAPNIASREDAPLPKVDGDRAAAPAARPEVNTAVAELIGKCRNGLMEGAAFILDRDGAAPPTDGSDHSLQTGVRWAFEHELRVGLRVLLVGGILGGGWAAFVPLAGAVVVPGNLVVQSNVKNIQHPTGGVVADIGVQDGSRVQPGELLLRLDATQARAGLQMVSKQLDELGAKIARLVAERDGLARIEVPVELASRSGNETVKSLLASEDSLFKARFTARQSQKDLLQGRVAQLTEEIVGLEAQLDSKARQLELIAGELTGVQELYDKHLVPLTRLTTLQRESARIEGERGQIVSSIAETKSKIGETQLQMVRADQDFRTDVVKELGEAQGKEAELVERSVSARDLLDRIEIHAPVAGVVHQLAAHTIGGVIRAGDTIMEIVPDTEDLQIEARLQPKDIDQVRTGQSAFVRFSAFNQRVTPQLTGSVSYVSADTSRDQQTNAPYFTVRVVLSDQERRRLAGQQLVPGMPAEIFMQTRSRTMMSYLFKPIADQMRRAFVEQ